MGDLSAVVFPDARLPTPPFLTEAQALEWCEIVNSLPADFFRPGDAPLLAAFCVASALHKAAAAALEADGAIGRTEKGWPYVHPATQLLNTQAGVMAQLAMKLRLCPSARMVQMDANKQAGETAKGARPWGDEPQRKSA